jgi:hypothetical protein
MAIESVIRVSKRGEAEMRTKATTAIACVLVLGFQITSGVVGAGAEKPLPVLPQLLMDEQGVVYGVKGLWLGQDSYDVEFRFGRLVSLFGSFWPLNTAKPLFWNSDLDDANDSSTVLSREERETLARRRVLPLLDALNGMNAQKVIPSTLKDAERSIPVIISSSVFIPVYAKDESPVPHFPLILVTYIRIAKKKNAWTCDLFSKHCVPDQGGSSLSMFAVFNQRGGTAAEQ